MKKFEINDKLELLYKGQVCGRVVKHEVFKVEIFINSIMGNKWQLLSMNFTTPEAALQRMNENFLIFFKYYKFPNVKERDVNEIIEDIKTNFPNCCVYDSAVDGPEDKKKDIPNVKPPKVKNTREVIKDSNERTKIGKNYQRLGYAETDDHDAVIYLINGYLYARDGATAKKDSEPLEDNLVGYLRVNKVGNKFVQIKSKDHVKTN